MCTEAAPLPRRVLDGKGRLQRRSTLVPSGPLQCGLRRVNSTLSGLTPAGRFEPARDHGTGISGRRRLRSPGIPAPRRLSSRERPAVQRVIAHLGGGDSDPVCEVSPSPTIDAEADDLFGLGPLRGQEIGQEFSGT